MNKEIKLIDFYNNKTLKQKLPIFNFKDSISNNNRDSNAQMRMIADQILSYTRQCAKPYYKSLSVKRRNRTIVVKGKLKTTYNKAYNGIAKSIEGKRRLIACLALNNELLQNALIEDANRKNDMRPALNLRANSIVEINKMNSNQIFGVMNDIMKDILYSGKYHKTAKKFNIK